MAAFGARRRVIALVAENENNTLAYASEGLGGFFAPFGYQSQVIDLLSPHGLQTLSGALESGEVAFVYAFAGIGSTLLDQNNQSIWTALRIPYVSFWYDHPAYNYRQHIVASPYILNCYHVRDHYDVWQNYLPHHNQALYLPPCAGPNPLVAAVPWEARERRFIFAKTTYDLDQIVAGWRDYPADLQRIIRDLIAQAQKNRNLDLTAAAVAQFSEHIAAGRMDYVMTVIQVVDHYVRAWRGDQLARALCAGHYPAHIYGRGWDYLAAEQATNTAVEFRPPFPNSELWPRLTPYRLSANVNPLWREGLHERVQNGIASGAVMVTDNSERSLAAFGDLPNYVGFEWTDDSLQQALAVAWEKSRDGMDYRTASTARVVSMVYTAENFMQPLEQALQALGQAATTQTAAAQPITARGHSV